jgi:hypothetical protein
MYSNFIAFYGAVFGIVALTVGPIVYRGHKESLQDEMLNNAEERLSAIPAHFGPWLLRDEESLNGTAQQMLVNPRYVCRTYVHGSSGETVSMIVLAGLAGPMAVHTPEICMPSREYESIQAPEQIEVAALGKKQKFFSSLFRAKTLEGQKVNVYYGWSRDGDVWEAPDYPRVTFAPLPMLYKVQVVCAEPAVPSEGPTAGEKFLADLLPLLSSHTP